MIVLYFSHKNQGWTQKLTRTSEWNAKKILKKTVTTISGNKLTDLLLSPADRRLDDSAVFQPHKSREDSKVTRTSEWNAKKI